MKQFDLENRCLAFSKNVRSFIKRVPKNIANFEDGKQLVRSSGSIGANYIEANEALSKKDFLLRMKIARKEARESFYWLNLLETGPELVFAKNNLIKETGELIKILSAIINKSLKFGA